MRYTTSKQQHKGKSNVLFNTLKTAISKNEGDGLCDKKLRLFGKNLTYIKLKVKRKPWKKSLHTCGQSQTSVCGQETSSGILAEASQIPQRF